MLHPNCPNRQHHVIDQLLCTLLAGSAGLPDESESHYVRALRQAAASLCENADCRLSLLRMIRVELPTKDSPSSSS